MILTQIYKFVKFVPKTGALTFVKFDTWQQIEHANYEYEYRTWNWWSQPKIIDSGKFYLKIEMSTMFINFDTQN